MAVLALARFAIRSDARTDAERAMHELATRIRTEHPGAAWTAYRECGAPDRYVALTRADDAAAESRQRAALVAALGPFVAGDLELVECELVTSSDLQRRHRR